MTGETERTHLTPDEVNILVDKAVRRTLTTLGVDISNTEKLLHVQADFAYMRKSRLGAEEVNKWAKRSVVGAFISGAIYMLFTGIRAFLTAKGVAP